MFAALSFTALVAFYAAHRAEGAGGLALGGTPRSASCSSAASASASSSPPSASPTIRGLPTAIFGTTVREPRGIERVTRHPFFVGAALCGRRACAARDAARRRRFLRRVRAPRRSPGPGTRTGSSWRRAARPTRVHRTPPRACPFARPARRTTAAGRARDLPGGRRGRGSPPPWRCGAYTPSLFAQGGAWIVARGRWRRARRRPRRAGAARVPAARARRVTPCRPSGRQARRPGRVRAVRKPRAISATISRAAASGSGASRIGRPTTR